jgi:hypothetical protein
MIRRTVGVLALVVFACAAALSARAVQQAASVLQELSVREGMAQDGLFDLLWDGSPHVAAVAAVFKAASPEKQAAIVNGLGAFAKAYTRTPLFRDRYAEYWQANRPHPPEAPKTSTEQNKEVQDGLRQMEESIKNMPPEMRKEMEQMVKDLKAQQEAMQKDARLQAMMVEGAKMQEQEQAREYEQRLKEYEAEHPKNPDALVAKRLREFLDLSATVNFDARLVKSGGMMRFEKTEYEEQSSEWKLCYRAGREATAAAREYAQAWVKELAAK